MKRSSFYPNFRSHYRIRHHLNGITWTALLAVLVASESVSVAPHESFPLRVHTPQWPLFFVGSLFLLLFGVVQYNQHARKKQIQAIRNQIAADLHDAIGSSLSGIGLLGALARNTTADPARSTYLLDQLIEETRQVSNALDDIVWSVNPRLEQSASLGARMYRFAATLFENDGIIYQIQLPEEALLTRVTTEQQRDLYFFYKEVVNNIHKHAAASSTLITLLPHQNGLQLTIRDNGRGFDPSIKGERNGLRNLHLRAQSLNGRLSIQAAPGVGATIQLWFPLLSR